MSTFLPDGTLPLDKGVIVGCIGRKGSGKTTMALHLFRTYPGDKVVLDIAGDDGPWGDDVITIEGNAETLPTTWPEHLRKHDDRGNGLPMILRYVPDPGSPTELDDIDAFLGMALTKPGVLILVHEMGRACPVHQTRPHMRRLLNHNRHVPANLIYAMPRAMGVDTLCIAQADIIYTFDLPNPDDRRRVAGTIGWPPQDFDSAVEALRRHEHLMFDANIPKPLPGEHDLRLTHCGPLPAAVVTDDLRWAQPAKERTT